jgi:hypothetical protein
MDAFIPRCKKHRRQDQGRFLMRSQPSPMIKFCLARAAACRHDAEQATDPSSQQSWLEMESRWFSLARSYERRPDNPLRRASAPRSQW